MKTDAPNSSVSKLVLAGGSGFLGQALAKFFVGAGYDVVMLSRGVGVPGESSKLRVVQWNPDAMRLESWAKELEGAKGVINLCGRSVDCRYSKENRRQILDSRVNSTRLLGEAIATMSNPPEVWLNASTATIYSDCRGDLNPHDENSNDIGHGFSVEVAKAWENAFWEFDLSHVRQVAMRISIVLGEGGAFPVMRRFAKLLLGGRQGPGSQWMSWLHVEDFVGIVEFLLSNDKVRGVVNFAAPFPVRNTAFMHEMRKRFAPLGIGFPAPTPAVHFGAFFLRTSPELVLKSRKVVSSTLEKHGYKFRFPKIAEAIKDLSA